jgi:hypothetical protein
MEPIMTEPEQAEAAEEAEESAEEAGEPEAGAAAEEPATE